MDEKDKQILNLIKGNARMSYSKLQAVRIFEGKNTYPI